MLKIADKMGKSRPYISNSIRLLSLPEQILSEIENGKLSQAQCAFTSWIEIKNNKTISFNES